MTAVRVIGIGSPFGSDRIGWDAIKDLSAYPGLKDVEANNSTGEPFKIGFNV